MARVASSLLGVAAAAAIVLAPPALAKEGFLLSTGPQGLPALEEAQLFRIRKEEEQEAPKEFDDFKMAAETETRGQREQADAEKLCATSSGVDVVDFTELVALSGVVLGVLSASRRRQELERLNQQLRTINSQLRLQARVGTMYAPWLTYVPPLLGRGSDSGSSCLGTRERPAAPAALPRPSSPTPAPAPAAAARTSGGRGVCGRAAAPAAAAPAAAAPAISILSLDEDDSRPEAREHLQALKEGNWLLREECASGAMVRFEKAVMLSKCMGDRMRERQALSGLAACARMRGKHRQAIKYLKRVLEISMDLKDHIGDADAHGTIADIYTDLGDLERAGQFYDKYIERLGRDGPM